MVIIRLGGPAYRIGMGGGAASSQRITPKKIKMQIIMLYREEIQKWKIK